MVSLTASHTSYLLRKLEVSSPYPQSQDAPDRSSPPPAAKVEFLFDGSGQNVVDGEGMELTTSPLSAFLVSKSLWSRMSVLAEKSWKRSAIGLQNLVIE